MNADMPAGRASKRKSANHEAIEIDGIIALHCFQGFENINLARKFLAVAIAAIRVKNDRVCRREFAERLLAVAQKVQFAQLLAPAVKPNVEPKPVRRGWVVGGRHNEAI